MKNNFWRNDQPRWRCSNFSLCLSWWSRSVWQNLIRKGNLKWNAKLSRLQRKSLQIRDLLLLVDRAIVQLTAGKMVVRPGAASWFVEIMTQKENLSAPDNGAAPIIMHCVYLFEELFGSLLTDSGSWPLSCEFLNQPDLLAPNLKSGAKSRSTSLLHPVYHQEYLSP